MVFLNDEDLQAKLGNIVKFAFDALSGAKLIVDEEGIILFASKYHYQYLGYEEESQMVGKYCEDVIPGTRMHIILRTETPEFGGIFNFINKDTHEIVPVVCNRVPIYNNEHKLVGAMSETVFPQGIDYAINVAENVQRLKSSNAKLLLSKRKDIRSVIVGESYQIKTLREIVAQCASFPLPVLITGETGCGKEVFADAIHEVGDRAELPFVKINCAAIPNELLESELFGYEPGAFSGALAKGKMGKLEYAGRGTVLLDEIGDMPMNLQSKLLRAIQDKKFEKVGGLESTPFQARIICTTNRNIDELIEKNLFRQDLYYRINTVEMEIPPLRERKDDIEILIHHFIAEANRENGLSIVGIDNEALCFLKHYDFPGNVRELKHIIERACFIVGAGVLEKKHFSEVEKKMAMKDTTEIAGPAEEEFNIDFDSLNDAKEFAETVAIKRALAEAKGNKSLAAKMLKVDRSVLYEKMKRYNIN